MSKISRWMLPAVLAAGICACGSPSGKVTGGIDPDAQQLFIGEDIAKLLEALQTQVEAAQKTLDHANRTTPARMQQSYMETLTKAIEDAQKLDETATAEQIGQMAVILDKANSEGYDNYLAMTALNTLVTRAKTYTSETKKMAESGKYDAIIALGVVIRGSTSHYDYVCNEAAKGIAQASMATGVPVTFSVVTTENIEQAIERAGTKAGNKGSDGAMTAIEMANLLKQL